MTHLNTRWILLGALLAYGGTLVIVAHDRYLLDRLPTQVIEVGDGRAARYLGNYEDYLVAKARAAAPPLDVKPPRAARSR